MIKRILENKFNSLHRLYNVKGYYKKVIHLNPNVIYKMLNFKVARRFTDGHIAAITDMTFSHDGRWLISASMDATAR